MSLTERGRYQAWRDWTDGAIDIFTLEGSDAYSRGYAKRIRELQDEEIESRGVFEPLRRPDRLDPEPSEPEREEFP